MRIGFSPAVYEHAAFLIGKSPWEVSRRPDLIVEGHLRAYELYDPELIIVGIDIYNLEAEAYGAQVVNPGGNAIPAIAAPLFNSLDEALAIEPFDPATAGRLPMIIECGRRLSEHIPPSRVRIPVSGPFSIATNLLGTSELLTECMLRPDAVREFLLALVEGQMRFVRACVQAGVGITMFESAATPPLLSPAQFTDTELPAIRQLIMRLKSELGIEVPLILGGNTAPILEAMLSTGTNYVICPAETDRTAFMAKVVQHSHVTVRVNLTPHIVVNGPVPAILAEVDKIIALAGQVPNRVTLGTGAVPYETPPAHIIAIKDYVSA